MGAFFCDIVDGLTALAADPERNLIFIVIFGNPFAYALIEPAEIVFARSLKFQSYLFPAEFQFQGGGTPAFADPDMIEFPPGIIVDLFFETE